MDGYPRLCRARRKPWSGRGASMPLCIAPSGHLLHITDAERGQPGLTCIECGQRVIARKGLAKRRAPHFAHFRPPIRCNYTPEGAAHRWAKALLHKAQWLRTPPRPSPTTIDKEIVDTFRIKGVRAEQLYGARRIDALVDLGDLDRDYTSLGVEIAVTHLSGEQKQSDLAGFPFPTIEIRINSSILDMAEAEAIRHLTHHAPRSWLFDLETHRRPPPPWPAPAPFSARPSPPLRSPAAPPPRPAPRASGSPAVRTTDPPSFILAYARATESIAGQTKLHWTHTLADLAAADARVWRRCAKCDDRAEQQVAALIADYGPHFSLWKRTRPCRQPGCNGNVHCYAYRSDGSMVCLIRPREGRSIDQSTSSATVPL